MQATMHVCHVSVSEEDDIHVLVGSGQSFGSGWLRPGAWRALGEGRASLRPTAPTGDVWAGILVSACGGGRLLECGVEDSKITLFIERLYGFHRSVTSSLLGLRADIADGAVGKECSRVSARLSVNFFSLYLLRCTNTRRRHFLLTLLSSTMYRVQKRISVSLHTHEPRL